MSLDLSFDVAIIGAGTAGMTAFAELRRLGLSAALIDHGPLGTTCARVGCMPSKAALHGGHQWATLRKLGASVPDGRTTPDVLWRQARDTRDLLAGNTAKRTQQLAGDHLLMGTARFVGPDALDVDGRRVRAKAFIVAAGSEPVVPAPLAALGERLITTDDLFDLAQLPARVGILGLGAIGLEMGLALSRLGVQVVAGDMKALPAGITDPVLGERAVAHFLPEIDMWLGQPMQASALDDGSVQLSAGSRTAQVDAVIAALGRRPRTAALDLAQAGVPLNERGQVQIDPVSLRAGQAPVFFAGDVAAIRPLMHEAVDEGVLAARGAAQAIDGRAVDLPARTVPLAIVFSDPDIAVVGQPWDQLDPQHIIIGSAEGVANGRSRVLGAEDNLIRLYAERSTGRLLGASLMCTRGEHIAHLLAWAMQRGETVGDLLKMPYYHPSIEELLQSALKDAARQLAS